MKSTLLLVSLAIAAVVSAAGQTYLEETFSDDKWEDRWMISSHRDDLGKVELSSGTFYADKEYNQGLQTKQDHRFYSLSTPFKSTVDNSKEDLFVQYTVKQEEPQECGGSYLKLLPENYDAKSFNGDSEYAIMFGPDVCGSENRIHVIFNYKGKNYLIKKNFPVPRDSKTHFYRLVVHPDQKYSLNVDGDLISDHVPLEEQWDVYPSRTIPDPDDKKPEDWVDDARIQEPNHVKPDNYDDIPRYIPDPDAVKPADWDDESDGEWEPAEIPNPDFEEWEPKYIDNPDYKGEWTPKQIPNPEFKEDPELAHYKIAGVGLDLWQVKSGSIFDDIVVTTDAELADKYLSQWKENKPKETDALVAKEKKEQEEKEAQKKREEEAAAVKEEETKKVETDELDEDDEKTEAKETKETKTEPEPEAVSEPEPEPVAVKEEEAVKETKETKKETVKDEL
ncbi:hypothetical protein BX616_004426 [Lobosporangium transversale]|uniref:Calreticulin n=1 Tax=Lobosporangium transversale TaxID=64571 RepID=A0A1Y2GPF1_9FUNG|nr:Calreticulin family-domain-containing protein [Lobosporangium transversale]KAF9916180.1 hypothetical protein BX616_004426 [Lobosporangium transversale]ORZ16052.1 Calreticulin family-domain-containing protein [Lobosporangium transversale]|eukprot:XP_021881399.1 Calreticulin family-domain-containing protein [Lobosporangium transversale]